jgi:hypothetical protein
MYVAVLGAGRQIICLSMYRHVFCNMRNHTVGFLMGVHQGARSLLFLIGWLLLGSLG